MHVPRLQAIRRTQQYHLLPVKPGMMLEIHEKVGDGNNQRIWKFKGIVLKVQKPNHIDGSFTIRGKTSGHTIEKIYPLSFPHFEHLFLLDHYKIARAKLYYLRDKIGKDAKMKSKISVARRGIDLLVQAREDAAAEAPTLAVEQSIGEDIVTEDGGINMSDQLSETTTEQSIVKQSEMESVDVVEDVEDTPSESTNKSPEEVVSLEETEDTPSAEQEREDLEGEDDHSDSSPKA